MIRFLSRMPYVILSMCFNSSHKQSIYKNFCFLRSCMKFNIFDIRLFVLALLCNNQFDVKDSKKVFARSSSFHDSNFSEFFLLCVILIYFIFELTYGEDWRVTNRNFTMSFVVCWMFEKWILSSLLYKSDQLRKLFKMAPIVRYCSQTFGFDECFPPSHSHALCHKQQQLF